MTVPAAEATPVMVPMLNPNEPEAVVVEHTAAEGQLVSVGDVLCVLETSKSTEELAAEAEGFVIGWRAAPGELVNAGDLLCYLATSPDWAAPPVPESSPGSDVLPEGLRISQPALALARDRGLDMNRLPIGPMVTVSMVQSALGEPAAVSGDATDREAGDDPTALLLYGGGGHGKTLIELVRRGAAHHLVGVVDSGLEPGDMVLGVPVVGGDEALAAVRDRGVVLAVNGVGGIARVGDRVAAFDRLSAAGFRCPAVVHESAVVEPSVQLPSGCQVLAHAYVGSDSRIGFGSIVNTGVVVSHDCVLEEYVNLSPGALLAGGVRVGAMTLVGMGVTVNLGVSIGRKARVGNSAVVKADVPDGQVVAAGSVWPAPNRR